MSAGPPIPSGTVTFLFTDIEGSTRLWESDAAAMGVALPLHDAILRDAIEGHAGSVFKTVGDAFCAAFSRPEDAVAAALDAQRRLAAERWPDAVGRIRVRMGIHTGSAVETDGDYFGPTVNRVARLMSLGAGEQIILSNASASLVREALPPGVTLRDLGTHRLKDLNQTEAAHQLVAEGLRADFPALRSLDARPNNLPFQISSFVGRERELREVAEALRQRRLVTIVGPGGIGKTRLALNAAGQMIDHCSDGVWLVELAQLRTPELIPQATADALHVREAPQERLEETLARSLASSNALLVLDCAEHLVSGTAAFVKMLLSRCASLKILVTSREPLHLTGEHVIRVAALENAAELFLDRAREVVLNLVVDDAAIRTIREICRRVDGIPLAVELAAARSATMPLSELNARLAKSLNVLVSRDPTKEERHRTLHATIAWSYQLLDADEAAALRNLGVFDGSFQIGAVSAVAGGTDDQNVELLDALVEKSLVSRAGELLRYILSDTVREFLIESLRAEGALAALCVRHFEYYASFVATAAASAAGTDVGVFLDAVGADVTNVRTALEWGAEHRPVETAVLTTNLSRYWKIRGHVTEGRTWMRRVLAAPEVAGRLRAGLLRRAATFATEQDDYDEARALTVDARTIYEELHDDGGVGEALHNLAVIEQRCGNVDAAQEHYASATAKFREVRHHQGESLALLNMMSLALDRDDLTDAARFVDEAASAAALTGNADLRASVSESRGELAERRGELDEAVRFYLEALALKQAIGNRYHAADVHNVLALVYTRQGRVAEARAAARETLRAGLELDATPFLIFGLEAFSQIALHEDRYADAGLYFGLARELRRIHSYRWGARKTADMEAGVRMHLGARFDAVMEECSRTDWRAVADSLVRTPWTPPAAPAG